MSNPPQPYKEAQYKHSIPKISTVFLRIRNLCGLDSKLCWPMILITPKRLLKSFNSASFYRPPSMWDALSY